MSEAEWLQATDPIAMLDVLDAKLYKRKLRLYCCAYAKSVHLLPIGSHAERAVQEAERYADGKLTVLLIMKTLGRDWLTAAPHVSDLLARYATAASAKRATRQLMEQIGTPTYHCSLFRHIIGNPFRPYPAPAHLAAAVLQLAESLYTGADCAFALHDALLEAGHIELAEHFAREQWHPKGCWVVDLILGKK